VLDKHRENLVKSSLARRVLLAATVASTALASPAIFGSEANAFEWQTVANNNTTIPGTTQKFSSFNQPSINNFCTVVFRARGKGPQTPPSGVFHNNPCSSLWYVVRKILVRGGLVPQPNNNEGTFNEFPAFPRIDINSTLMATRGQSTPVWTYTVDGIETRVGTAGVYAGSFNGTIVTGASQLGAVPDFPYFAVPGFPGVKFDQFPGSAAAFNSKYIAFKGNFTDGTTSRTGVYYRNILDGGTQPAERIADTTMDIPGTAVKFGSTAPPSAALGNVVFLGVDNEDAPTVGGIYQAPVPFAGSLTELAAIGGPVPGVAGATFTHLGEALSFNGLDMSFWGAWGTATQDIKLYCPVDGNPDLIAACIDQCPDSDADGHFCTKTTPVNQGIFLRHSNGKTYMIARAGARQRYKDFLFWVFSGHPPGTGLTPIAYEDEGDDAEPPRWRASAFSATSSDGRNAAVVFKGLERTGASGIYMRQAPRADILPVVLLGDDAQTVDPQAPAGSVVTAVGVERDSFRRCRMAINASFLNATTSESWAGIYVEKDACRSDDAAP